MVINKTALAKKKPAAWAARGIEQIPPENSKQNA
jgi:hypothetical protein